MPVAGSAPGGQLTLPPEARAKGVRKEALYLAGQDDVRTLFGTVLDLQAREDDMILIRDRQRSMSTQLLETWLNDVLMARAPDAPATDLLHAEPSSRKGLLTFGLDRQALLGAGLTADVVDRLYRGLYVYTVGFSDLLRVRLNFWCSLRIPLCTLAIAAECFFSGCCVT